MANHPNRSKTYRYTAYTMSQDGSTFTHRGALGGAVRKAKAYAQASFPAWQYAGYGPTIKVMLDDVIVHEERL